MSPADTQIIIFLVLLIFGAGGHFWITHNHIATITRMVEGMDARLRRVEQEVAALAAELRSRHEQK